MPANLRRWSAVGALILALGWFLVGINWGLPSRRADPFLFGPDRPPWTGKQILQLTGDPHADADRGADVDANPIVARDTPIVLNDTDPKRAEIVRRYRLYSYQPDEMITFNALRQMNPAQGRLDPRLYQYGGLWVYPVGGMLKLASLLRLVELRADVAYYLDQPEAFARFYVVARLYSALWGSVGAWVVYRLVLHITTDGGPAPLVAAACFVAMPVVVNMAHEAKPHLPGAVLMLLAVMAATNYVRTGRRRCWIAAGIFCGAAFGMVLSALPVFIILPVMTLLRRQSWRDRIVVALAAALIGIDVYFMTNPYALLHLVRHDRVLASNLGNSAAMYHPGRSTDGVLNAIRLIAEGTSPVLAVAGTVGAIALGWRAWRVRKDDAPAEIARRAAGLLLAAPAMLVLVQFIALAAGKPAEYGRFAILPDTFLAIEAAAAAWTILKLQWHRRLAAAALSATTAVFGFMYLLHFIADCGGATTRLRAAKELASLPLTEAIAVENEPAPYSLPPVNLFTRRIVLLPRGPGAADAIEEPAVRLRPVDEPAPFQFDGDTQPLPHDADRQRFPLPARISWAGKTFELKWIGRPPGRGLGG